MRSDLSRKGRGERPPGFWHRRYRIQFFKQPRRKNDCKTVIASAAKQSIVQQERVDCFAALGMTANADTRSHSRGAMRPRFAINLRPENRGRGECRAPDAPAASCALWVVSMHTSIHSEPSEITRHSRTQWFTAYTVLSPVIGFLATVVVRINPPT